MITTPNKLKEFLALAQHPNIEVKLFNPYRFRKYRAHRYGLDLNVSIDACTIKALSQIIKCIDWWRNMTNQYYNVSDNYQFSDVDVMLVGTAVKDISIPLMNTGTMNMPTRCRKWSSKAPIISAMKV
jgi:phosphatidylserine/phosphatidylglycerophosphate/cardiolipin synthase-like enzyme